MLVHAITRMINTGRSPLNIQRTFLVTGALAALMESGYQNGKRFNAGSQDGLQGTGEQLVRQSEGVLMPPAHRP